MQEDMTSSEALRDKTEAVTEQANGAETERKTASFGDTLTLQAILCVLMTLGFIATNMLNGNLAADIFELYQSKFGSESTVIEALVEIVDFLGTAPINNV